MCTTDTGVLGQVWWGDRSSPNAYTDFNTNVSLLSHSNSHPNSHSHSHILNSSSDPHTPSAGKFSKDEKSPDSLCHSTSAAISTTCACGPRRTSCRSTPRRISSPRLKRAISSTSTCLEEVLGRDRQIKNRVKSGLVGLLRG